MRHLNFTQFCTQNSYPANEDILNHSILSPSGRISKRAKRAELDRMSDRMADNLRAHAEYNALILSGDVVDPSGEYTREWLVIQHNKPILRDIECHKARIKQTLELSMAYTKSGKLRKGYQACVDGYNNLIEERRGQLIT